MTYCGPLEKLCLNRRYTTTNAHRAELEVNSLIVDPEKSCTEVDFSCEPPARTPVNPVKCAHTERRHKYRDHSYRRTLWLVAILCVPYTVQDNTVHDKTVQCHTPSKRSNTIDIRGVVEIGQELTTVEEGRDFGNRVTSACLTQA